MVTLFGIKNCDSVKKARRWLTDHNIDHHFHDFREDGLSKQQVKTWVSTLGWENLINKRSTSWKSLSGTTKNELDNNNIVDVIMETPTLIKRPLLDKNNQLTLGFRTEEYSTLFSQ